MEQHIINTGRKRCQTLGYCKKKSWLQKRPCYLFCYQCFFMAYMVTFGRKTNMIVVFPGRFGQQQDGALQWYFNISSAYKYPKENTAEKEYEKLKKKQ